MKLFRILFQSFFLMAHLVVISLFLLAGFSDRISPEYFTIAAYLGLLFPIFCVLNLCFVLYWLFTQEWKVIWFGLISFVICWGPVKQYFPYHDKTVDLPKSKTIKILTYNVMSFGYKNHTPDKPNPILTYIANSEADVVCLQEYSEDTRAKYLTKSKIYNALKMYPYRSIIYLNRVGNLKSGLAVFSKYPIENSKRIEYDSEYNGSSRHTIVVDDKKISLFNNHLESFKLTFEDRKHYSSFIKEMDSKSLESLAPIQQKLGVAYKIRAQQADVIAKKVKEEDNMYTIVCGDLNDTPISYACRTVGQGLISAFAESGRGMGVSYNENYFWFRIDHIFHSSKMKAYNCTVDKVKYSDHYPIWSILEIK